MLKDIFKRMCILIGQKVWGKIEEFRRKDPLFNSNDNADFKKAIKALSIYDLKV